MSMQGKVVAITGGARGIGLAAAKLLASRGAKVSICDVHKQETLDQAAVSIEESASEKGHVLVSKCDVRDVSQVTAWLKAIVDKHGQLDHVANVAGVWHASTLQEQGDEAWDQVIAVNMTGAMYVLRESLNLMTDNNGCSIAVVASVCGLYGYETQAAYCASKHGVIGLARCAAKEAGPRGIRVNCIAPGIVDTHMIREGPGPEFAKTFASQTPIGRQASADEIAKLIAFLLSDESSFVMGSVYSIDGGLHC